MMRHHESIAAIAALANQKRDARLGGDVKPLTEIVAGRLAGLKHHLLIAHQGGIDRGFNAAHVGDGGDFHGLMFSIRGWRPDSPDESVRLWPAYRAGWPGQR